jgi:hypothetical protein
MKHIKLFEQYSENEDSISGRTVLDYFTHLGSDSHSKYDNPVLTTYKNQILNNTYAIRNINLNELLENDIDLKDFVESQYNTYKMEWGNNEVKSIGLIGDNDFAKDVVIDGYHRVMQKVLNGENTMLFYVPLNSKYY